MNAARLGKPVSESFVSSRRNCSWVERSAVISVKMTSTACGEALSGENIGSTDSRSQTICPLPAGTPTTTLLMARPVRAASVEGHAARGRMAPSSPSIMSLSAMRGRPFHEAPDKRRISDALRLYDSTRPSVDSVSTPSLKWLTTRRY